MRCHAWMSTICVQVVAKPEEEEHNPLKNWREKMSGQPLPEDPAKKSRDLKVPAMDPLNTHES